jgi:hypothetical protein
MNFNGFSNKRIPDLVSAITLTGSEYVSIFQDGTLKKVTVSQISAGTGSIDGSVPSGGIEGNFLRKSSGTNFDSAWANITEDDLPATVKQGLERMLVIGELSTFAEFATGLVCDYVLVWAPFTIKAIDVICPITPASGSITIDIVYRATPGGELTSLYTNNSKPTIQCNGYASWETFTGSNLPNTVQLAQGSILGFRIVSAPKDAQDLYITVR